MADDDVLAELEAAGKDFDKDAEIERILSVFRLDAYSVLGLQPGVPESDIKKTYRIKSLLIHPDKTKNPKAPDAFDRLKKAQIELLDEKSRSRLDEYIADARMLTMRDMKLTVDDEQVKSVSDDFAAAWKEKTKWVIMEETKRRERMMKAQLREEGRQQRKEDEEMAERKRKREHEDAWEKTREQRMGSWRDFQKGGGVDGKKKKKKVKTLG